MAPIAPSKMKITSVENPSLSLTAQFNPQELELSLRPIWAKHVVPGLSHPVKHYSHTDARQVSFDLEFNADSPGADLKSIEFAQRFLQAMCYTSRTAQGIKAGQPNRLLFVWPNFMSWVTTISDVGIRVQAFNRLGAPIRFTAKLVLEEIRDVRLYSEDILSGSEADSVLAPEFT